MQNWRPHHGVAANGGGGAAGDRLGPGDGGFGHAVCRTVHRGPARRARRADVGLSAGERRGPVQRHQRAAQRGRCSRAHGAFGRHHAGDHAGQPADRADLGGAVGAGPGQRWRRAGHGGRPGRAFVRSGHRHGGRTAGLPRAFVHRRNRSGGEPHLHVHQPAPGQLPVPERHAPAGAGADGPGRPGTRHRQRRCGLRPRRAGAAQRGRCRHARPHCRDAGQRRPDHLEGGRQQHAELRAALLPDQRPRVHRHRRQRRGRHRPTGGRGQRLAHRPAHRQRRPAVAHADADQRHLEAARRRRLPVCRAARAGDGPGSRRQDHRCADHRQRSGHRREPQRGAVRPPRRDRQCRWLGPRRPGGARRAVRTGRAFDRADRVAGGQRRHERRAAGAGQQHHRRLHAEQHGPGHDDLADRADRLGRAAGHERTHGLRRDGQRQ